MMDKLSFQEMLCIRGGIDAVSTGDSVPAVDVPAPVVPGPGKTMDEILKELESERAEKAKILSNKAEILNELKTAKAAKAELDAIKKAAEDQNKTNEQKFLESQKVIESMQAKIKESNLRSELILQGVTDEKKLNAAVKLMKDEQVFTTDGGIDKETFTAKFQDIAYLKAEIKKEIPPTTEGKPGDRRIQGKTLIGKSLDEIQADPELMKLMGI